MSSYHLRHRRRSQLAPRQAENTTTTPSGASTSTQDVSTSSAVTFNPSTTSIPTFSSNSASFPSASTTTTTTSSSKHSSSSQTSSSSKFSSSSPLPSSSTLTSSVSPSDSSPTHTASPSTLSSHTPAPTVNDISTSQQVVSSSNAEPTPATTFVLQPFGSSTTTALQTSTLTPSTTSKALSSLDSGFFANKGAVAGTFTVVGLVGIGAIAFLIFMRRRVKNAVSRGSEFFESFSGRLPVSQAYGVSRSPSSPEPSITELSSYPPMDPHAMSNSYHPFSHNNQDTYHNLTPIQEDGSQAPTSSQTPRMFGRPGVHRHSYQPSIDSFYGRN